MHFKPASAPPPKYSASDREPRGQRQFLEGDQAKAYLLGAHAPERQAERDGLAGMPAYRQGDDAQAGHVQHAQQGKRCIRQQHQFSHAGILPLSSEVRA